MATEIISGALPQVSRSAPANRSGQLGSAEPVAKQHEMGKAASARSAEALKKPDLIQQQADSTALRAEAAQQADEQESADIRQALGQLAERMNEAVQAHQRSLEFSVNEDTGRTVIKVIDRESGEVIREIPPEEAQRLKKQMQELSGVLLYMQA